jgi:hypothetical protein
LFVQIYLGCQKRGYCLRLTFRVLPYAMPAVLLGSGLLLIFLGAPWSIGIVQVGSALIAGGLMLQLGYFLRLIHPVWKRLRKEVMGQIPIIVLMASQAILASTSILPPSQTFLAVILLSSVSGWHFYRRQLNLRILRFYGEIRDLLDKFRGLNFEPKNEAEDFSIVRLLEMVSPPPNTDVEDDGSFTKVTWIGNAYMIFRSWLSSIRHKVDLIIRNGGNTQEIDVVSTVEEFISLYNNFMEKIVHTLLQHVSKSTTDVEAKRLAKIRFSLFRENLDQLRFRFESLLKELRKSGLTVSGETLSSTTDLLL